MIYLCALSDPLRSMDYPDALKNALEAAGEDVIIQEGICRTLMPEEKAEQFNEALGRADWILDLSGGNLANTVLPYLDYAGYRHSNAVYMGFSDCSLIANALYALSGKPAVLYSLCSGPDPEQVIAVMEQLDDGVNPCAGLEELCPSARIAIGGNIRCFLKLAGTPYMPQEQDFALFLESYSADWYAVQSMLSQLEQCGLFEQAACVVLGDFTVLQRTRPSYAEDIAMVLAQDFGLMVPVLSVSGFGHLKEGRPVWIGRSLKGDDE